MKEIIPDYNKDLSEDENYRRFLDVMNPLPAQLEQMAFEYEEGEKQSARSKDDYKRN